MQNYITFNENVFYFTIFVPLFKLISKCLTTTFHNYTFHALNIMSQAKQILV